MVLLTFTYLSEILYLGLLTILKIIYLRLLIFPNTAYVVSCDTPRTPENNNFAQNEIMTASPCRFWSEEKNTWHTLSSLPSTLSWCTSMSAYRSLHWSRTPITIWSNHRSRRSSSRHIIASAPTTHHPSHDQNIDHIARLCDRSIARHGITSALRWAMNHQSRRSSSKLSSNSIGVIDGSSSSSQLIAELDGAVVEEAEM